MALAERELAPPTTQTGTQPRLYTEEEYLAREEVAEDKSELVDGELQPMSGGTTNHGAIQMYLGAALVAALGVRDCAVYPSDVKVRASGQMYYPDVSVVCGEAAYYGGSETVITNPILVAEVASPSTESTDRGRKMRDYLGTESLLVYLLVSQSAAQVEMFARGQDGQWRYQEVSGLDAMLDIPPLAISLALADVYKRAKLSETSRAEGQE